MDNQPIKYVVTMDIGDVKNKATYLENTLTQLQTKMTYLSSTGMQTVTTTQNFGNSMKQGAGLAGQYSSQLNGLAMRFVGLQAVVGYATKAIESGVEWIRTSIEEYKSFQNAIAEVSTILLGDEMKALGAISAGIENLSVKWGKSTEDIAAGMYDILSAAFEAKDAMNLLSTSVKASIAGLSTVEESVDVFTTILNAYGMTVYQATTLSDQLFETVRRGKLIFDDLSSSMGYIVPIAANFGVEIEEVLAALATATRQGQRADMATRGLALALQNIVSPSKEATVAAAKYGVDLSDIALRVGGLESVLKDLNIAMGEHGKKILPELITNMRSMRVIMALVSDEGLAGYAEDLNLINEASGRTDQAITKMANTVKMQNDIIDQSMKRLERDVGQAWYGVELAWKKEQLWWGTFLTGGDADKAIQDYEKRITSLRSLQVSLLETSARLSKIKPIETETIKYLKFQALTPEKQTEEIMRDFFNEEDWKKYVEGVLSVTPDLGEYLKKSYRYGGTIQDIIGKNVDWESVNKYLTFSQDLDTVQTNLANSVTNLANAELKRDEVFKKSGWNKLPQPIKDMIMLGKQLGDIGVGGWIGKYGSMFTGVALQPIIDAQKAVTDAENVYKSFYSEAETLQEEIDLNTEGFNKLAGGLDSLVEQGTTTQDNITELTYALDDLKYKIKDTYETLGGQKFEGTSRWELAVTAMGISIDRFSRFSQIAIKYGDAFDNTYMDGTKTIDGYSEAVGNANDYLNYYNEAVWEATIADSTYKGSIDNLIKSLSNYNKEIKKSNDELQKNNIAIQELELKGMMRRHGLTRGEENKIKKLKIENAKISLEQAKKEFGTLDTYKELYEEYVDRVQFAYANIKDARDSDIEDLIYVISQYETNYDNYSKLLIEQRNLLDYIGIAIRAITTAIDNSPAASAWLEFFGQSAADMYLDTLEDIDSYLSSIRRRVAEAAGESYVELPSMTGAKKYKIKNIQDLGNGKSMFYSTSGWQAEAPSGTWKKGEQVSWQRGSYYIPTTQPYMLHKGEQVVPAGKKGGGDVHVHLDPIKINAVLRTRSDIDNFGVMVGRAIAAGVIDGVTSIGEVG